MSGKLAICADFASAQFQSQGVMFWPAAIKKRVPRCARVDTPDSFCVQITRVELSALI
jgi:hypothetical protein